VLRSWRETVRVLLTPPRVTLSRSVWPNQPLPAEIIDVGESPADTPWRAALDAFERSLPKAGTLRRPIHLALSHHYVRFADVPWQPKILTAPSRAIQAEHRFKQLYGTASAGWSVTVSESSFGASALAAAIEENLLTELQRIAAKNKTRFDVIEPWGIAPINAFRRRLLKGHNSALVLAEDGKRVVLLFRGTALASVATRRGIEETSDKLSLVVNQEAMAVGLADIEQRMFVTHCDQSISAAPDIVPLVGEHPVATAL